MNAWQTRGCSGFGVVRGSGVGFEGARLRLCTGVLEVTRVSDGTEN